MASVLLAVVGATPARALEVCFIHPSTGACAPAYPCPPEGCPAGFQCVELGYGYVECAPVDRVYCCHIPSGGHCGPGLVCVPHQGEYGACLPWRGERDAEACEALLDAGGGAACAAHDCDRDGMRDDVDLCVCVSDDGADDDRDGLGDACDDRPARPDDAGAPPVPDAGAEADASVEGGRDGSIAGDGSEPVPAGGGCGCRTVTGSREVPSLLLAAAVSWLGFARRRRR